MKKVLLLVAILATALAKPGGHFHQEFSSRSSSSSYKNNELQHQTEDESFYSKQGDLEGRVDPKVNTYSQHLEYQNPNNQNGHATSFGMSNQDAFRQRDNSGRYAVEQELGSDGIIKTVSGKKNQFSYTARYGVSGGATGLSPLQGGQYDTQSNLLSLTQRLQNELSAQLHNEISKHQTYNSYSGSSYVDADFRALEQEIKANLSRELQDELHRQYGTQSTKGSHSYTVQNGRYATQANYNTQELEDLTTQMSNNLMQQLRNEYQNTESSSSGSSSSYSGRYSQSQQVGQGSRAHTSMYRPYQEPFPLNPEVRPSVPLTNVVSQVLNTVDSELNDALAHIEEQYLSLDRSHMVDVNYDRILDDLKEELKRNISVVLDNALRRNYGPQEEHGSYYYTSSQVSSGSRVANYKIDDLNSLKQQVVNSLVNKLNNSIRQQKETYQTMRRNYSSSQTHNINRNTGHSNNYPSTNDRIYTSYVAFTPSRRPDTVYSQSSSQHAENSYTSHGEETRPAYRPSHQTVETERPIRYGYQPSSHNTNYDSNTYQTNSHNQESQTLEQMEYDSRPSGSSRPQGNSPTYTSPYRGNNYPYTNGGNYASTDSRYPTSGSRYPSSGSRNYPSSTGENYQGNTYASQSNSESSHNYVAGQRETGIQYTPGSGSPEIGYQAEVIDIKDQIQDPISRQINTAIQKQREAASSTSYTYSNSQVLENLSEELKRNLTRKIEEVLNEHYKTTGRRDQYTFRVSTGGQINPGNYNREQLTSLTNQLQEDLLRQLREGLAQKSYSQSSSYTSSGTSYQPVRTHGSYGSGSNYRAHSSYSGSYSSGSSHGECCMQSDDATSTTLDGVVHKQSERPTRGDIGISSKDLKKNEDDQLQQKTEDIDITQKQEDSAEIEVVPPENTETTTTRTLARNKPSYSPAVVVKPISQQQKPIQNPGRIETSTGKAIQATQDLLNFEKYNNNNQNAESSLSQQQTNLNFDQQHTEDLTYIDQENFDQSHVGSFDQETQQMTDNFDQQTLHNFDQQQTGLITQQTIDQFNQQENSDFSQQHESGGIVQHTINQFDQGMDQFEQQETEDQNEETSRITQHNLNQQNIHGSSHISQHTDDLTQQTEDMNEHSVYQPSSISQTHISQSTDDLNQHTEDLTQQLEDILNQSEDLAQHTEDSSQHTEDLSQHFQNNNQQTRNFNRGSNFPRRYSGYNPAAATQETYMVQQNQDLSQQTEDMSQHAETFNQNSGNSNSGSQNSYRSYNTQSSSSHSSASSASSSSRQIHYGSVVQVPLETAGNLDQQQLEKQYANVVQDVSHQARSSSSSSASSSASSSVSSSANLEQHFADVVEIPTTTEEPGFWKKLGGKISNTYHKAKDSITSIG